MVDECAKAARPPMPDISHLLLVDDDQALLAALSGTLKARFGHFSLDTIDSGVGALELAKRHKYDTIIMDVNMPRMNGFEVLSAVRTLQPHTPVLLISGHADETMMAKAIEQGAVELIPKPFDREKFVLAVRRSLALSAAQSSVGQGLQQHTVRSLKAKTIDQKPSY